MNQLLGQIYNDQDWPSWNTTDALRSPPSGEFLVQLRNTTGELCGAVRDPLGQMPAYFTVLQNGQLALDSSMQNLLSKITKKTVNWNYLYQIWADSYESTTESPIKEISKIPAGHVLYKQEQAWQTRNFFSDLRASSENLREVFFEIVRQRAKQSAPFSLLLSGGFDSSLLLAVLKKQDLSAHTVGINFKKGPESESEPLRQLQSAVPFSFDEVKGEQLLLEELSWAANNRWFYSPSLNLFKPLLQRARQMGSKTVWTGLGADEVFVRDSSLMKTMLMDADVGLFLQRWRKRRADGLNRGQLIYEIFREFLPYSIRKTMIEKLQLKSDLNHPEVHHFARLRRLHRLENARKYLRQGMTDMEAELRERLFHSGAIAFCCEQEQALAESYQLNFSYPYLDLRLSACVLKRPSDFFFKNQLDKFGLRSTFSDLLPKEICFKDSTQSYSDWSTRQISAQKKALEKWISENHFSNEIDPKALFQFKQDQMLKALYCLQVQTWT